jgi:hypothetical protein
MQAERSSGSDSVRQGFRIEYTLQIIARAEPFFRAYNC